jgi:hypothetical protein
MRAVRIWPSLAAVGLWWLAAAAAPAQQVTVTTPFHAVSDSFFEQFGTHWGFDWGGLHVTFGGPSMAVPPFGMFDPNAGIHGGFAVQGNGLGGFFNFAAGQGYRQSLVSQAPSVTLLDGYPGYISDTSQSPFVVGLIPVVGGFSDTFPIGVAPYYTLGYPIPPMGPAVMQPVPQRESRVQGMLRQMAAGNQSAGGQPSQSPLLAGLPGGLPSVGHDDAHPNGRAGAAGRQALDGLDFSGPAAGGAAIEIDPGMQELAAAQASSAGRAVPSVAEARRLHQLEEASRNEEATLLYERGRTADEGGKPGVAKIYYNMALRRASGGLRERILARLKALSAAGATE